MASGRKVSIKGATRASLMISSSWESKDLGVRCVTHAATVTGAALDSPPQSWFELY